MQQIDRKYSGRRSMSIYLAMQLKLHVQKSFLQYMHDVAAAHLSGPHVKRLDLSSGTGGDGLFSVRGLNLTILTSHGGIHISLNLRHSHHLIGHGTRLFSPQQRRLRCRRGYVRERASRFWLSQSNDSRVEVAVICKKCTHQHHHRELRRQCNPLLPCSPDRMAPAECDPRSGGLQDRHLEKKIEHQNKCDEFPDGFLNACP